MDMSTLYGHIKMRELKYCVFFRILAWLCRFHFAGPIL